MLHIYFPASLLSRFCRAPGLHRAWKAREVLKAVALVLLTLEFHFTGQLSLDTHQPAVAQRRTKRPQFASLRPPFSVLRSPFRLRLKLRLPGTACW